MSHDDDTTARNTTRTFALVSSLGLTALAALFLAATPGPLTWALVARWAVTWVLGGLATVALGSALVYAIAGCLANLHRPAHPPLRAVSRELARELVTT